MYIPQEVLVLDIFTENIEKIRLVSRINVL